MDEKMGNLVTYNEGHWVWLGGYDTKDIPKNARWWWNKNYQFNNRCGYWITDNAPKASLLIQYFDQAAKDRVTHVVDSTAKAIAESRAIEPPPDFDVPAPIGMEYKPYQLAGIHYALQREKTLIGDVMGLGKTIQAIGVINMTAPARVLIVCPKSVKLNWQRELKKWLVMDYSIQIPKTGDNLIGDIIIINPQIIGKFRQQIDALKWNLLILDEFHFYKNPKADRTCFVLGGKIDEQKYDPIEADRVLMLTGTPIPNRVKELWPVMQYTGLFRNWQYFVTRYCDGHNGRFGWEIDGASNLDELQATLRSKIMIRRMKEEVLKDLPAKIRQIIELERNGFQDVDLSKFGISKDAPDFESQVEKLTGEHAFFTELSRMRHEWGLQKIEPAIEFIDNLLEENDKAVVFCWHNDVASQIFDKYKDMGAVLLNGQTPEKDRDKAVMDFQDEKKNIRLFVGTIGSAGVGITLTAASTVVMVESDWVPASLQQAEGRCDRIGQKNIVNVYYLVFQGSIDGIILSKIIEKMDVQDRALDRASSVSGLFPIDPVPVIGKKSEQPKEKTPEVIREYSTEEIKEMQGKIKALAGMCDGARTTDGSGFNRYDTKFGHALANAGHWTPKMAASAEKLIIKYRNQLK